MLYNNIVVKIVLPVLPPYQPIPNRKTIWANVQTILEISAIKYNFRTYTDTGATFGFTFEPDYNDYKSKYNILYIVHTQKVNKNFIIVLRMGEIHCMY